MKRDEITIEITDYCRNNCKYCSSNATGYFLKANFLPIEKIIEILGDSEFDRIIISGGEPLYHHDIGNIIELCRKHADDVIVYSNLITHLAYNAHVIDGVKVECLLNVTDDVSVIRVLKRVGQGKEKTRPEVTFSKNFAGKCNCDKTVVKPDGSIRRSACRKDFRVEDE